MPPPPSFSRSRIVSASRVLPTFGTAPAPNAPPPIEPGCRGVGVLRSYAPGIIDGTVPTPANNCAPPRCCPTSSGRDGVATAEFPCIGSMSRVYGHVCPGRCSQRHSIATRRRLARRLFAPLACDLFRSLRIPDRRSPHACWSLHAAARTPHRAYGHIGCELRRRPCTDPDGAHAQPGGILAISATTRCAWRSPRLCC